MQKQYDILVVGELNVDLILNQLPSMPVVGKEILAGQMNLGLGSSSAIFASNSSSLGAKVAFAGMVGDDMFGRYILEQLQAKSVDTSNIIQDAEQKTGATIVFNQGEDRAMITHQGAMSSFGVNQVREELICNSRHLHVSSVFLQPLILKDIVNLFAKAKICGLTTSLDMQWDPAEKWDISLKTLLPFVDVFMPNEAELLAVTKSREISDAIAKLRQVAKMVVVKQGVRGSTAFFKNTIHRVDAVLNTEIVDAIGAGDSFNAGFISKFIQNSSIKTCLEYGSLMGALNTTSAGGTSAFASYEEIKKTIKQKFGKDI
jgi:sugar/nucleoside kinase (ribokinase family)